MATRQLSARYHGTSCDKLPYSVDRNRACAEAADNITVVVRDRLLATWTRIRPDALHERRTCARAASLRHCRHPFAMLLLVSMRAGKTSCSNHYRYCSSGPARRHDIHNIRRRFHQPVKTVSSRHKLMSNLSLTFMTKVAVSS